MPRPRLSNDQLAANMRASKERWRQDNRQFLRVYNRLYRRRKRAGIPGTGLATRLRDAVDRGMSLVGRGPDEWDNLGHLTITRKAIGTI